MSKPMPDDVRHDVPLAPLTTWGVGGPARWLWNFDPGRVAAVIGWCRSNDKPWTAIGKGSNVLVDDAGFDGLVVHLRGRDRAVAVDLASGTATCSADVPLPTLAMAVARAGGAGLEWMTAIPGTVGGGVVMNAGVGSTDHGEVAHHLVWVDVLDADGNCERWSVEDCAFAYRSSAFQAKELLVLRACFHIRPAPDPGEAQTAVRTLLAGRKAKQPLAARTAGSTFISPPGQPAGRLLEAAGCKSMRHGGAMVSPKHANWIEAGEGCSADDIRNLIVRMRAAVLDQSGIALEPEIHQLPRRPWPWQVP